MGIGTGIFLIGVGAILRYAVTISSNQGINLRTVGDILMIVGVLGVVLSMFFWSTWGGFGRMGARRRGPRVYERDIIDRDRGIY